MASSRFRLTTIDDAQPGDLNADRECARRLIAKHGGRFRYLSDEKVWTVLADGVWRRDRHMNQMMLFAEEVADQLQRECLSETDKARRTRLEKLAKGASTAAGQRKMLARAQREPGVSLDPSRFDSNPWLICCLNGALDLRTGQLREHRPDDYFARQVPVVYDPNARSAEWESFLSEAQPNPETRSFLQRAAGYSLTGNTDEEAFLLLHGPTATGKSTFLGALRSALGDYAVVTPFDTFMARPRGRQIRNDIARLDGVRFVAVSECNRGDRLDAGQIKSLTGGDVVTARYLRQEFFEFKPQCKIWMAVNDRPLVSADDGAVWRRIFEVPFMSQVWESKRSGAVKNRLLDSDAVGPAILKWAVDGCRDWQRRKLDPPEEVLAATLAYRAEMAGAPERAQVSDVPARTSVSQPEVVETPAAGDSTSWWRRPWGFFVSFSGSMDVGPGRAE